MPSKCLLLILVPLPLGGTVEQWHRDSQELKSYDVLANTKKEQDKTDFFSYLSFELICNKRYSANMLSLDYQNIRGKIRRGSKNDKITD